MTQLQLNNEKTQLSWRYNQETVTLIKPKILYYSFHENLVHLIFHDEAGLIKDAYYELTGQLFYAIDRDAGQICYKKHSYHISDMWDAAYDYKAQHFWILVSSKSDQRQLIITDTTGQLIRQIQAPEQFEFYRLENGRAGNLTVVCTDKRPEYQHRNRKNWRFNLDVATGQLVRIDLAY